MIATRIVLKIYTFVQEEMSFIIHEKIILFMTNYFVFMKICYFVFIMKL